MKLEVIPTMWYRVLRDDAALSTGTLTPKDVYDFYWITYAFQTGGVGPYGTTLVKHWLRDIKQKYLSVIGGLVQQQLVKYHSRRRIDPGAYTPDILPTAGAPDLDTYMKATYRSDMRRRNKVWESLTTNLSHLYRATDIKQTIFYIDRLNNDIHNTGELVITKLHNGEALLDALETAHSAEPRQLRALADRDLRKLDEQRLQRQR